MPNNSYTPALDLISPVTLRSLSTRRSRLFAGGTYIRSIDSGQTANNITAQIVKEGADTYLIIVNQNLQYDENILGPVGLRTRILDMTGSKWNDLLRIEQLDTVSPRAQQYSISCSVAFARQNGSQSTLPQPTAIVPFALEKLFALSGKLAVKVEKNTANFTSNSVISIAPRFKIYKLLPLIIPAATDPVTGTATPEYNGIALANMRTQVNAAKIWVDMPERSGTPASDPAGPPAQPLAVKFDQQDDSIDAPVGTVFAEQNLSGGDGLPDNPTIEKTGPTRSIVLINYGEKSDGSLGEVNTVYEWVGEDALNGRWKAY